MAAVEARLTTWSNLAACPLVDQNEVAASPQANYLEIEYPYASENRLNIGNPGLYREEGGIRFVIHRRVSDGIGQATTWADELRAHFRDRELTSDVITLEAAPALADEQNRKGTYYLVPFVLLYQYDLVQNTQS